jgi:hypothetical protein
MAQLQPIIVAYHALAAQFSVLVSGLLVLVGSSSLLIAAIQKLVDTLPAHAAADTILGKVLQLLAKVSHNKLLNAVAANPTAAHASQVTK